MRNPRRTSSTAAALMIGLTLVVSMGVFASSLKASFGDVISDQTNADLFVTASSAQAPGFSPSVVDAVRAVPGVDEISPNGWGQARFASEATSYSAVDPATAEGVMNLDVSQGSLADLGKDGVVVSSSAATAHGWEVGDTVPAEFAETGKHRLQVVGIYDGKGWIADDYIISLAAQNAFAGPQLVDGGPRHRDRRGGPGRRPGRHRRRPGRPPGRPGAGPGGLREGGQRVHRPAADLRHRDAAAGRR